MATKKAAPVKKAVVKSNVLGKADLIANVAKVNALSKVKSEEVVSSIIDFITASLKKGQNFQIIGFGAFKVADRKARKGRNPANGKVINIAASKAVRFSVGSKLKAAVNGDKK